MKLFRNLTVGAAALTFMALPTLAQAATLTLEAVLVPKSYQQTTNRPCVIGENSCNYVTPVSPDVDAIISDSGGYIDITSARFLVSTIEALIGSSTFWIGFDVNQANGQADQTIEYFAMFINGNLVDSFGTVGGADTPVPPTVGGGNGNGYADYLFKGFSSLALFNDNDIVTFQAILPVTNDGREQFFLIGTAVNPCPNPPCVVTPLNPVPEPATLVLFGAGLAAMAVAIRRRRRTA